METGGCDGAGGTAATCQSACCGLAGRIGREKVTKYMYLYVRRCVAHGRAECAMRSANKCPTIHLQTSCSLLCNAIMVLSPTLPYSALPYPTQY
jgi:hypothetical protein